MGKTVPHKKKRSLTIERLVPSYYTLVSNGIAELLIALLQELSKDTTTIEVILAD